MVGLGLTATFIVNGFPAQPIEIGVTSYSTIWVTLLWFTNVWLKIVAGPPFASPNIFG